MQPLPFSTGITQQQPLDFHNAILQELDAITLDEKEPESPMNPDQDNNFSDISISKPIVLSKVDLTTPKTKQKTDPHNPEKDSDWDLCIINANIKDSNDEAIKQNDIIETDWVVPKEWVEI